MSRPAEIDHIIILLPHADVVSPPSWLADNFTISPGGKHADGKTENKLILFKDGSYIELIAFIDDSEEHRKGHWWDFDYGIIDFALTDGYGRFDSSINDRLDAAKSLISYDMPKRGGRTRPDGVEMEWDVTFPNGVDRGVVPFWCHDITPRDRRVPLSAANTEHACGALGVHTVKVLLPDRDRSVVNTALASIVGASVMQDQRYTIAAPEALRTQPQLVIGTADGQRSIELILQTTTVSASEGIEHRVGKRMVKIGLFESVQ